MLCCSWFICLLVPYLGPVCALSAGGTCRETQRLLRACPRFYFCFLMESVYPLLPSGNPLRGFGVPMTWLLLRLRCDQQLVCGREEDMQKLRDLKALHMRPESVADPYWPPWLQDHDYSTALNIYWTNKSVIALLDCAFRLDCPRLLQALSHEAPQRRTPFKTAYARDLSMFSGFRALHTGSLDFLRQVARRVEEIRNTGVPLPLSTSSHGRMRQIFRFLRMMRQWEEDDAAWIQTREFQEADYIVLD
jgi:hypothetical protein